MGTQVPEPQTGLVFWSQEEAGNGAKEGSHPLSTWEAGRTVHLSLGQLFSAASGHTLAAAGGHLGKPGFDQGGFAGPV